LNFKKGPDFPFGLYRLGKNRSSIKAKNDKKGHDFTASKRRRPFFRLAALCPENKLGDKCAENKNEIKASDWKRAGRSAMVRRK
jgi:hypothetical protein